MNQAIKQFLAGKPVTAGFVLEVEGEHYHCEQVLRWLPRRRLVIRVRHQGGLLLLKLFAPDKKGRRELSREQYGYKACKVAGVAVPAEKMNTEDFAGCFAVAYEFIVDASPFDLVGPEQDERITALLQLMLCCHQAGIYQHDIHTDNILMNSSGLFLIDLASIRGKPGKPLNTKKSLNNLARLVSQFPPDEQQLIVEKLHVYYKARGWFYDQFEQEKFEILLKKAWHKRKRIYLNKCFRTCTMTAYFKDNQLEYAFKRSFFKQIDAQDIQNIDDRVEQGEKLKDGNSATVVLTEMGGRKIVIKRYNIKSYWHFLKRCWRPSRAANAWRQGNLMALLGIHSPEVLGFVEKRLGPLRKQAYLISEYVANTTELSQHVQHGIPTEQELVQLRRLFSLMREYRFTHGDMKASNLLRTEQGVLMLIDLDAMREHRRSSSFQRALSRDQKRLLKNWESKTLLQARLKHDLGLH